MASHFGGLGLRCFPVLSKAQLWSLYYRHVDRANLPIGQLVVKLVETFLRTAEGKGSRRDEAEQISVD
jgi:hypothetical protein